MSKRHIFKSKFHVCCHFLDIKIPGANTFINPSCPKHPNIIDWNKKWHKSHFFEEPQEGFMKARSVKIKKLCNFPPYLGLGRQGLRLCCCQTPDSCHFRFLSNRETQKQKLRYKNKTSLLAHYSNWFSANNFGILFIIIVLQYAPKYYSEVFSPFLLIS